MKEDLIRISYVAAVAAIGIGAAVQLSKRSNAAVVGGDGLLLVRPPGGESFSFWTLLITAWTGLVLIAVRLDASMPMWFLGLAAGVLAAMGFGGIYALQRATWRLAIAADGVRQRNLLRRWHGPDWSELLQVEPTPDGSYLTFEDQGGQRLVVGGWILRDPAIRDALVERVPDAAITKSLTDLLERWEDEVGRPG